MLLRLPAGLRPYGPPLRAGLAVDSFIIAVEVMLKVRLLVLLIIVVNGLAVFTVVFKSAVVVCVMSGLILFSLWNIIFVNESLKEDHLEDSFDQEVSTAAP